VELLEDFGDGGGCGLVVEVGAGGGEWSGEVEELEGSGVVGDADGDAGLAGGEEVGEEGFFVEDEGEWSGEEAVCESAGGGGEGGDVVYGGEGVDGDGEGDVGGAVFEGEEGVEGFGVGGVGAEGVEGVGGVDDDVAVLDCVVGFGDVVVCGHWVTF
jgi:hypothetical protein